MDCPHCSGERLGPVSRLEANTCPLAAMQLRELLRRSIDAIRSSLHHLHHRLVDVLPDANGIAGGIVDANDADGAISTMSKRMLVGLKADYYTLLGEAEIRLDGLADCLATGEAAGADLDKLGRLYAEHCRALHVALRTSSL